MKIAVDAMGGDHGCGVIVDGVILALRNLPFIEKVYVVGDEQQLRALIQERGVVGPRIEIVHASQFLEMNEKPIEGLRKKPDASIVRAIELVKEGLANGVVSPGNTGGVLAASTIKLRTLLGVDRPAILAMIPAPEHEFVLIDAGANVECRPINLAQFAVMGEIYAKKVLGIQNPRVGLLSVGTEEVKGTEVTQEAHRICKQLPINFVGNIEGHDLFANRVDVVVCDGFVGNIVLKTCESLAMALMNWIKREIRKNPKRILGAILAHGAFRAIKRRIDPEAYGGAPLLGINGNVVIAHGSSRERAIMNAIRQAVSAASMAINEDIVQAVNLVNSIVRTSYKASIT